MLSRFALQRLNHGLSAGGSGVSVGDQAVIHGPELGVFQERVPGGKAADDDAGAAIEPAAAKQIKLQEPRRGVGEEAEPARLLAGIVRVEGGPGGITLLLVHEAVEVERGVVNERLNELADFVAGDDDVGMDAASFVLRTVAAEETDEA